MGAITPVRWQNGQLTILTGLSSFTKSTSGKLFYSNNPESVASTDAGKALCKSTGLTGTVMVYTWHVSSFATNNCLFLKNESSTTVTVNILRAALTNYSGTYSDVESWANIFNGAGSSSFTIAAGATATMYPRSIAAGHCFGIIAELSISGGSVTMADMIYSGTPAMPTVDAGHESMSVRQYGVTNGYITTFNPTLAIGQGIKFGGGVGGDSYSDADMRTVSGYNILGNYGQFMKFNLTVSNTGTSKSVFIELGSRGGNSFPIVQDSAGVTTNVLHTEGSNTNVYYDVISETIPTGGKTISFITCVPAVAATPYVMGVRLA